MRKRIIGAASGESSHPSGSWLDLERLAEVEVTSEEAGYPIESALRPGGEGGWRAGESGAQTIRLRFDEPQRVERMRLAFHEKHVARTHEFVLRWSGDGGRSYREIVRQQYTFSPPNTDREVEEYEVKLDGVTAIELRIVPEIGGGEAKASLESWLLG